MTILFDKRFSRTLDTLVADAIGPFEAWTFDDAKSRKAAQDALAAKGVKAHIRSAYKPLLHFFLEEVQLVGLESVRIVFPVHPNAPANRFTLEAYPLAAMLGDAKFEFVAQTIGADVLPAYDVQLTYTDGAQALHHVLAPNRVHTDLAGETNLSPTGWLRNHPAHEGIRLDTDYEALFEEAMQAIAAHEWGGTEPYFEELNISATYPAEDERLSHGDEAVSLREALHEEFYFSLLEFFQKKSGRPLGDRGLRPGQIVPEIVLGAVPSVCVSLRKLDRSVETGATFDLETIAEPPYVTQIEAELDAIGGETFEATTRSGRIVRARYVKGTDAPVMISGGQHANENTGIVGALRAAKLLRQRPGAHFTISPLENPDGYALHQRLRLVNPRHMHHAARYTAFGDDLEYRTAENTGGNLGEKNIRNGATDLTHAPLHVNLHGYPSHEWTRPLSGYVPRNFAMWTLPKGFFLVMRHHEGWDRRADTMLNHVTRQLGKIPGLITYNDAQIELYEIHAGETGFRIINGFPCLVSVDDRHTAPLTLITEYPDETIYGDDFIAGHTAQMVTVISAYDAMQMIVQYG
ncbi:peptidase M14 [Limoniibacter endophyticus]|uniref:Peptidase M14 n=1 Tax=Limoniibacter endophyticus TaxID=1565040 RepID=A0A8J3GI56_9HYPH|nr:peptidase M14 [Limoniibacter endophyticus]GHC70402.1 peptidase M14 [Limoniibacter endophyticus]